MSSKDCVKVIHKQKGMKALMKRLEYLQDYQTTVGIHKGDGKRKVSTGSGNNRKRKNGKMNIATLAKTLESDYDIKPTKDLAISTSGGNTIFLLAGHAYHQVARHFIKLQNVPAVWGKIQSYVSQQFLSFLNTTGRGNREGIYAFRKIGEFVETLQRSQIIDGKTAPNTAATSMIKGKNHPLLDEGNLLKSIDHRVTKQSTGRKVRFSKIADNIEKTMMSVNK